ncbi:hypothetical protein SISNIDRAFT_495361 [Sistotremastrum niveocremeum HHB9708]|uniref:F-box domain-containing protein n=1 Tax=Sistotremastrum niveocremeum HHB9708 TaxID=1314777 RepID=A0A164V414_9AGAM|nr:hypothetical protein SISNIDRAFT_495361 [Sistotremastrum niveocremeum HHB9708]
MPSSTGSSPSKRPRRTCTSRDDKKPELSQKRSPSPHAPQRRNPVKAFWSTPQLIAGLMELLPSQALYRCSLVSQSISSLALDALWAADAKIINLLRILAPLVPRRSDSDTMNFSRTPRLTDWDRFYTYSARVRDIECTDSDLSGLSHDALLKFFTTIPPGNLPFPHLHTLRWSVQSELKMQFLNMFIHNGLNTFIVSSPLQSLCGVFDVVARFAPNLAQLKIRVDGDKTRVSASLLCDLVLALKDLNQLQVVEVPAVLLTPKISKFLSTKASLTVLWACEFRNSVKFSNKKNDQKNSTSREHFVSLLNLSLEIGSLLGESVNYLAAPLLVSLHVEIPQATQEDWDRCVHIVARNCFALRSLSVSLYDDLDDDIRQSHITLDGVKEILKLPSLEALEIDDNSVPGFDDQDMELLAPMCTKLLIFALCLFAHHPTTSKTPTFASLIPFAQHCPNMESLGYFIDGSIPPPSLLPGNTPLDLCSLEISPYTKVENTATVVAFLVELLSPDAKIDIDSRHCYKHCHGGGAFTIDELSPYQKKWEEVEQLFSALQPIREKLAKKDVGLISSASEVEL